MAVPDHLDYFERWQKSSNPFQQRTDAQLNVRYGEHERNRLDVFRPRDESNGIFLFIHGGYWQAMDKSSFSWLAGPVNRRDETLVSINYGLCPTVSMATLIEHVRQALLWVYRNRLELAKPAARLTLCGHSAGGHLLAELLTSDWRRTKPALVDGFIKQAISISGLFDLRPLIRTSVNHALMLNEQNAATVSPILRQPTVPCELELCLGALESRQYHWQSENLQSAWRDSMPNTRVTVFPDKHHFSVLDAVLDHYGQAD